MKTFLPTKEWIKPIGRTMPMQNALWLCYSATGAAFHFKGKTLHVSLLGDDRSAWDGMEGNHARVKIFMDGEVLVDVMMDTPGKRRILLQSTDVEEHVFEILKVSESAMSTCGIGGLYTDDEGEIRPVERREHLIEFAGDSITCGYGVDDELPQHNFRTDTEDASKGYAYLTCKHLNADHSLVSLSGYGIISGYSGDGLRHADQRLPMFYDKMGFSYGSFQNAFPQDAAWNFHEMKPDLIVINLGTNDDSFTKDDNALRQEYCKEYQAFLKKVRMKNPSSTILCILGMMGERLCPMVEQAVNEYKSETGDLNIRYAKFSEQLKEDGWAADWHPTQLTHRKNAEKLSAMIKDIMHW